MDREKRLEAISLTNAQVLCGLADEVLESMDVDVSRGPTVGLLMVRVEEPSERVPFNFTEVTVSEAEVTALGQRGYAMIMGRDPEKALAGAIVDLAVEVGHSAREKIETALHVALADEERRLAAHWEDVRPTRVAFEEMSP
jgi:alpha-D-ribose 1-methylphosphonate 5-triphosphate synthase subunit PhnG